MKSRQILYTLCAAILALTAIASIKEAQEKERQIADVRYQIQENKIQELAASLQEQRDQLAELFGRVLKLQSQVGELRRMTLDIPLSPELQSHTYILCRQNDIPYEVLLAIMEHESGYQTDAIGYNRNGTFDLGLCQINSVNHEWLERYYGLDVSDPYDNIEAAIVILRRFLDKYPLERALAAYAAGESGMLDGGGMWFAERMLKKYKSVTKQKPPSELALQTAVQENIIIKSIEQKRGFVNVSI